MFRISKVVLTYVVFIALLTPRGSLAQEGWLAGPLADGPDGTNGTVHAITQWDPDGNGPKGLALVVGGVFTSIEGASISNLAIRDPATGMWTPVPNAPRVKVLAVYEGKLVVGAAPGARVLTWDGVSWQELFLTTQSGEISAIAVHDNSLYVGGTFYTTNTTPPMGPAMNIARWNPVSQKWDNLNSEYMDFSVDALAFWNGELVVGGAFTQIGGFAIHGMARWNGSTWFDMGLTDGYVRAIQPFLGGLFVGGTELMAGSLIMSGLGRWNNSGWSSSGFGGLGNTVTALTVYNGRLVMAGAFNPFQNIAQYDGVTYSGLGSGIGTLVNALYPFGGVMYTGGSFTTAGGLPANRLARWNGTAWSTVGGGSVGGVLAMTNFMGRIVAGGSFTQSTFGNQPAVNIVQWDGMSLTAFGSGMNDQVNALKSFQYGGPAGNLELIAGGYFTTAGGVNANRIARWNADPFSPFPPPAWEPMGPGMDGPVLAIERYNGSTYAGGSFWASGPTALANIGRWNESTDAWENIVGSNGPVYTLKVYNGFLYAGGSFTAIGGVSTGGFARYNGSSWSNVGGFFLGSVYALEVYNGLLAIGGDFAGINSSPDLAYYNGSNYGTFGIGGSNAAVTALHASGGRLYVGGTFTQAGGVPAPHLAYWDGSWHAAAGGVDNSVYALGAIGGEEQVGGVFLVGGSTVSSPGWARFTATGVPWFVQQPSSQSVASGANLSFTARTAPGYAIGTLQWYRRGAPAQNGPTGTGSTVLGANEETLILENVSTADAGLYKLVVTNSYGGVSSFEAGLTVDGWTAVSPRDGVTASAIEALGPNPTTGPAGMAFTLKREARVQMRILDVAGRVIREIDAGAMAAGRHLLRWDGHDDQGLAVRTGLYFVRLEVEGKSLGSRRLVIQR